MNRAAEGWREPGRVVNRMILVGDAWGRSRAISARGWSWWGTAC